MLHRSDLEDDIAAYLAERVPQANIDRVFDVGANVGWFSWQFLKAYPHCRCFLFEPVESIFQGIRANLSQFPELQPFPRTQCFRLALGMTEETRQITATPKVTTNRILGNGEATDGPSEAVQVTTGDAFCIEHDIAEIGYLKIDAEGFDLEVLLGFGRMLTQQRIGFVQVEAGMSPDNALHVPAAAFEALLGAFGYRKFRYINQASSALPVLSWADVVFINERLARRLAG